MTITNNDTPFSDDKVKLQFHRTAIRQDVSARKIGRRNQKHTTEEESAHTFNVQRDQVGGR